MPLIRSITHRVVLVSARRPALPAVLAAALFVGLTACRADPGAVLLQRT